jgi:poly(A) polymerase
VSYLGSFENMAKVEASIGLAPDPPQRLAALAVAIPEDAERLRDRLRLTNAEHVRLSMMGAQWWRLSPEIGEQAARATLYRLGATHFIDCALLAWARSPESANNAAWHALATLPQRWTAPVFPLKAADFIKRGVPQGPALGAALRAAEAAWVEAGFPDDAAALEKIASAAMPMPV